MSLNNSTHGDRKLQTVQLAYDDNSEDTLRLHNQQQQQKAGQEWDNWDQQPVMGGPRNVRIVSIENEQLLNQNQEERKPNGNTLENPLYKVGLKLNKKQANMLRNNGYQSPPDNYDNGKLYTRRPRSFCCKLTTGVVALCLLILILGLAIGIPVSHKKGKLELPRDNQLGDAQVRDSKGNLLSAEQLQQEGVVEVAHDVCCPDRACEVGYPGQPINGIYTYRIQAFGQNATTNSTPSVILGAGQLDSQGEGDALKNVQLMFYPYYHNSQNKEGVTNVEILYDPATLAFNMSLQNRILQKQMGYVFDKQNASQINGAQLKVCLRSQQSINDNLAVNNFTINGTNLGDYVGRAQGSSCEEFYFSGRFYQGFNMSFALNYGMTSNLKDLNQVEMEFFKYDKINAEVCAFTIGSVSNNPSQPGTPASQGQSTVSDTVNDSQKVQSECGALNGCIGVWDLDVCLKGNTSLSTATNDLNNKFGKAISDWNVSGCITVKQKDNKTAVQQEVCPDACEDEEEIVGLRMTVELGKNCNQSIVTDDLYNFFKTYESSNSAENFGGCEPEVKRVHFNSSTSGPHHGRKSKKASLLRLF